MANMAMRSYPKRMIVPESQATQYARGMVTMANANQRYNNYYIGTEQNNVGLDSWRINGTTHQPYTIKFLNAVRTILREQNVVAPYSDEELLMRAQNNPQLTAAAMQRVGSLPDTGVGVNGQSNVDNSMINGGQRANTMGAFGNMRAPPRMDTSMGFGDNGSQSMGPRSNTMPFSRMRFPKFHMGGRGDMNNMGAPQSQSFQKPSIFHPSQLIRMNMAMKRQRNPDWSFGGQNGQNGQFD